MLNKTNKKITFLHGLGSRKEYKILFPYFNVPQIDWINGSLAKLKLGKPDILIGFSMGAIEACEHAIRHKVKHLVLCSLTPGIETLNKIKADKVTFLAGANEKWVLSEINRVKGTLKCDWNIIIIPNTGHRLNKKYLKEIKNLI